MPHIPPQPPPTSIPPPVPFAPPPPPSTPQTHHTPPPQPPTTPRTQHSEDPEVATPHEGPYPYPYPSHSTDNTAADHETNKHATDLPTAPPPSTPPPLPLPLPLPALLRDDWLAARAPEYYSQGEEAYYYGGGGGEGEGRGWRDGGEGERVCGLRPIAFWVVVVLLVALFGGAIGGGVGGGLAAAAAERGRESATQTTSTSPFSSTTTLDSSTSPTPVGQDSINCPSRTGQFYTTTNGSLTFLQLCGTNICPETCDIVSASKQQLDTFEECMDACATYNRQIGTQKCVAVAWDYQQVRQSFDKLCWLKLSQAPLVQDNPADGLTVGAVVVQS